MNKIIKEIIVRNAQGVHARPAALFVQIVSKFDAQVRVRKGDDEVDGKSIMGILTLGAQQNATLVITAEGDDAAQVIEALEQLLGKESLE